MILDKCVVSYQPLINKWYEEVLQLKEDVLRTLILGIIDDPTIDPVSWAKDHRLNLAIRYNDPSIEYIFIDGICYGKFVMELQGNKMTYKYQTI